MYPRVLIVGTVPYNENTPSRAFDAYFHSWERASLRQVFSDPRAPQKGHCSSLYQITDKQMLLRRFGKIKSTGVVYNYDDLPSSIDETKKAESSQKKEGSFISALYKLGKNKTPFNRLARKWLWKKKYWNTESFRAWLDEFKPECVFLAFSDDFFINDIALFVADRFNIPIMACIGDDYYFNDKKSLSPLYHVYRKQYKKLIDEVFSHRASAIYISDKIRDKYNAAFSINGQTVYLNSTIERKPFSPINVLSPKITYCGNVRLGRAESLAAVAKAFAAINPEYKVEVYTAEKDERYLSILRGCTSIVFKGEVSYGEVKEVFSKSDVVLAVEGFDKESVNLTRYSLSTKAADSICSGCLIVAFGSKECGLIEYLLSVGCAVVADNDEELINKLKKLIFDIEYQRQLYALSARVAEENHDLLASNKKVEKLFEKLLGGEKK